jgi:hypothetical protein
VKIRSLLLTVLLLSALATSAAAQGSPARIQVDARQVLGRINPMLFGQNLGAGMKGAEMGAHFALQGTSWQCGRQA